jgi:uncharacterized protein YukE
MGNLTKIWNAATNTIVRAFETTESIANSAHNVASAGERYTEGLEAKASLKVELAKLSSLATIVSKLEADSTVPPAVLTAMKSKLKAQQSETASKLAEKSKLEAPTK